MNINEVIEAFKELDLSEECASEIDELLKQVGTIGYMIVTLHRGKSIMRGRPIFDEPRFSRRQDFSFKPQSRNCTFQRASTPNRTMFYGSILPEVIKEGDLDNCRLTCVAESMPWLWDKKASGVKKIAFGRWRVHEPLNLIAIIHKSEYHLASSYTRDLFHIFRDLEVNAPKEVKDRTELFLNFLAEEFSKPVAPNDHLKYQISSYFTENMTFTSDIDGVMYPSTKLEGKGFNIAIKPESVDKMGLYVAGESIIYKLRENMMVGNSAVVELDGKSEVFEMIEEEKHVEECLRIIGANSIDDLV